jgi:hypothetical protein
VLLFLRSLPKLVLKELQKFKVYHLWHSFKNIPHHSNGRTRLSFLKLLPIIILVEFRDYIAILGGLIGILATFTGIMWMLVQQINKRIDDFRDNMDKRLGELRGDMDTKFEDVYRKFGELRNNMDTKFDDVYRRLDELKNDMDTKFEDVYRRFGGLKDDMDRRFSELRSDVDGKLGELKGEVDKRFGELRSDMDRRFGELREEIKEIKLLLYKVLEVPHKQRE